MTLRDIGEWFSSIWARILSDFNIALNSSPLDWPIWILLGLVFVVVPGYFAFMKYMVEDYRRNSGEATIWTVLGAGIGAILTTLVTLDAYFTMKVFGGTPRFIMFMRICYPFMTIFFVTYFILVYRHWLRQKKG
ncbi:hypothetical protein [Pseudotabrizicola formosa]|uniref:hypothetical protein n=1 Tax=Pseudotabrizicola formosa TaxID=2030009 RepID=UPI0011AEC5C7|nr:hypothetical protein [Pseudotabrizicola formosa]